MDMAKTKQSVVCTGIKRLRCTFDELTRVKNTSCLHFKIRLVLINARACVPSPFVPVITQPYWAKG